MLQRRYLTISLNFLALALLIPHPLAANDVRLSVLVNGAYLQLRSMTQDNSSWISVPSDGGAVVGAGRAQASNLYIHSSKPLGTEIRSDDVVQVFLESESGPWIYVPRLPNEGSTVVARRNGDRSTLRIRKFVNVDGKWKEDQQGTIITERSYVVLQDTADPNHRLMLTGGAPLSKGSAGNDNHFSPFAVEAIGISEAMSTLPPLVEPTKQYCKYGSDLWLNACQARCDSPSGSSSTCPQYCSGTPPPGFVLMDYRTLTVSGDEPASVSRIAAGQTFDFKQNIEQVYDYLIDLPGSKGKDEVKGHLQEKRNSAVKEALNFSSSHQMLTLKVQVPSVQFGGAGRWSEVKLQMKVRCIVPPNLRGQLLQEFDLN